MDTVLGIATEADVSFVEKIIKPIMIDGEKIVYAFKNGVRDHVAFTTHRFVVIDKQGISGKRMTLVSYPYKDVLCWTMSTAGSVDVDCEMSITVKGMELPLALNLGKKVDIAGVYKALSAGVLLK